MVRVALTVNGSGSHGGSRCGHATALGVARSDRAHGHEVRLRRRNLRCVHRAGRGPAGPVVPTAAFARGGWPVHHDRGIATPGSGPDPAGMARGGLAECGYCQRCFRAWPCRQWPTPCPGSSATASGVCRSGSDVRPRGPGDAPPRPFVTGCTGGRNRRGPVLTRSPELRLRQPRCTTSRTGNRA
jgi:hypothetical protein